MERLNFTIIALILTVGFSFSQQSIYVRKAGAVDYQSSISSIDSMKISATNTFDIYKNGSAIYQTSIASTDSITFLPPNSQDTCLNRLNTCDWNFQFIDTFDGASSTAGSDYGLNDNLPVRQTYNPDFISDKWVRKSGFWSADAVITAAHVQVNRSLYKNMLSLTSTANNTSGLMLNKLISSGNSARYRVSFIANPLTIEKVSDDWVSFMLDASNGKDGHVANVQFGFLIGSNGSVQVMQNGNNKTVVGSVPAADSYSISLDINSCSLIATVNGTKLTAILDEEVPTSAYAYLGTLFNSTSKYSTVDDLVIATPYSNDERHVVNYGYYWTDRAYGTHFNVVSDYTNFNFVEYIDGSTPNTKSHIVQARWQFWSDTSGVLRPDWEIQWNLLLAHLRQNIDKVKGIYLFDEPFWAAPIPIEDFNMVMDRIKADLPELPLVAALAWVTIEDPTQTNNIAQLNSSLNILGADKYVSVANFPEIEAMYNKLVNIRPSSKNLMLIPQTFFEGTKNDVEVAKINWLFYRLALQNPNVSTIFNFGLWSHTKETQVPITLKAQRIIGNAITNY